MVQCGACATDNTPDSRFCKNCGAPIGANVAPTPLPAVPPPKDIVQQIADAGKRFGEEMGLGAEGFGKGSGSTLKDMSRWWDETLGIMSPILFGVFGVVLIVMALFLADVIAERSDQPQFWRELIDFGRDNFLLLVGLMFLGSFQAYFYRRYHSTFKWIIHL